MQHSFIELQKWLISPAFQHFGSVMLGHWCLSSLSTRLSRTTNHLCKKRSYLCGDPCMICAGQPQNRLALHALVSDHDVLNCYKECMPHMKLPCHIWRRPTWYKEMSPTRCQYVWRASYSASCSPHGCMSEKFCNLTQILNLRAMSQPIQNFVECRLDSLTWHRLFD